MLAFTPCTLPAAAQVSASHRSPRKATEYLSEIADPDHGHAERDMAMLEFGYFDVHSPTITGGSQQSLELLLAANWGIRKWWAETAIGQRLVISDLLRDLQAVGRRRPAISRARPSQPLSSSLLPPLALRLPPPLLAQGQSDGSTYPPVSSTDIASRTSDRFSPVRPESREGCCGRNAERLGRIWSSSGWEV
jgi:hypothetical protein